VRFQWKHQMLVQLNSTIIKEKPLPYMAESVRTINLAQISCECVNVCCLHYARCDKRRRPYANIIDLQRPCSRAGVHMALGHKYWWWDTNFWCWARAPALATGLHACKQTVYFNRIRPGWCA